MKTSLDVLENSIQKTNTLLEMIEADLDWQGRHHQAYHALRIVLHALRDRLSPDDAVRFAAQLPTFIRGVFFEDWRPLQTPVKMNREEFLACIAANLMLDVDGGPERVTRAVLSNVFMMVDPAEIRKIAEVLPTDFTDLLA